MKVSRCTKYTNLHLPLRKNKNLKLRPQGASIQGKNVKNVMFPSAEKKVMLEFWADFSLLRSEIRLCATNLSCLH